LEMKELMAVFLDAIPNLGLSRAEGHNSGRQWTRAVLGFFRDIGTREGFKVHPDRTLGYFGREYLVDLCWLKESPTEHWMELAMESEWGNKYEATYDFEKLLYLNAPLKLFVCSLGPANTQSFVKSAPTLVANHKRRNSTEQYGVVMMPWGAKQRKAQMMEIEAFIIDGNGIRVWSENRSVPDLVMTNARKGVHS